METTELIERASKSLAAELLWQSHNAGAVGGMVEVGRIKIEPLVRAVLIAIRDPSAAMVQAVPDDRNAPIYPEDIWQAMIDAAIADER